MPRLSVTCALLAALIAVSCSETTEKDDAAASGETIDLPGVPRMVDVEAPYETPYSANAVSGVAFWASPDISFNNRLIVNYEGAGLVVFDVQNNPVNQTPGAFAGQIAVAYGDNGAATFSAYDTNADAINLFSYGNANDALVETGLSVPVSGAPAAVCFADLSAGLSLYVVEADASLLTVSADGAATDRTAPIDAFQGATGCAADDAAGTLYVSSATGELYSMAYGSTDVRRVRIEGLDAGALAGLSLFEQADGEGYLALAEKTGAVHLVSRGDLKYVGGFRIAPSMDVDGVEDVTLVTGFGDNFGGVYRNGVIAVGDGADNQGFNVKLVPWNGVANALGLEVGKTFAPRDLFEDIEETSTDSLDGLPAEIVGEGQSGGENN